MGILAFAKTLAQPLPRIHVALQQAANENAATRFPA
jgi:hypothetical protein